jgi:hypothetical protein
VSDTEAAKAELPKAREVLAAVQRRLPDEAELAEQEQQQARLDLE